MIKPSEVSAVLHWLGALALWTYLIARIVRRYYPRKPKGGAS